MRVLAWICALLTLLAVPAQGAAQGKPGAEAGDFDYYVLSLSWNAAWCEAEGAIRGAPQCDPALDIGFVLHGLWPQYETGWPEFCRTAQSDPSRAQTRAMADVMGSGGLAWYQWKKHGRCTGLSSNDYFALAREAWSRIERPEVLRRATTPLRVPPRVIEQAFLEVNPGFTADGVTVTCKDRMFREVRICLNRDLTPRTCSGTVARDCEVPNPLFTPMR